MRRLLQRLLLPLAMVAVTQTSFVSAESIRLKGPNGEIQSSPQYSEPLLNTSRSAEPSRFYGPTSGQETLWGIASSLRPDRSVSIQQTLYAIYQLNPQAFDAQNIHELIPGSTLRIPSLEQISSVSTQQAIRVMDAHQARLQPAPQRPAQVVTPTVEPQTAQVAAPQPVQPVENQQPQQVDTAPVSQSNNDLAQIAQQEKVQETKALEKQLESSESELMALEEKNLKLRMMLAQVQSEVDVLKDELGDEDRIRNEVEKLLEAERLRLAEEQKMAPSALDKLLSNTWLVAALAIIPGLLIGALVLMLLGRRKQEQAPQEVEQQTTPQTVAPVVAETLDNDVDDELILDDDLFGESEDDDLLLADEVEAEESAPEDDTEEDVFAGLDEDELDLNLEGEDGEDPFAGIDEDGDLDDAFTEVDLSTSDIQVKGEEKALGLEEMERAFDEVVIEDESVNEGFDLSDSDDEMMSQDDLDDLLAQDVTLDESDDEFELDKQEPLAESEQLEDDLDIDSLLAENADSFDLSDDEETQAVTPNDDIDDIFAMVEAQSEIDSERNQDTDATDEAAIDLSDEFDDAFDNKSDTTAESSLDDDSAFDELIGFEEDEELSADDTSLLDELVDEDEFDSEFNLDAELDELIGDDQAEDELQLSEDSTDLLDEFVDDSDADDIGDESTDLFEELLDIEKQSYEEPETGAEENSELDPLAVVDEQTLDSEPELENLAEAEAEA
ncbi:FimV/HubP family polar landmark protein, partial [Vibrio hepatarius]